MRTVTTLWSGFNGGTGFSGKEGIYLINAKGCTTVTQPDAKCRHFVLQINVDKDCVAGVALSITAPAQTDAHYTVNSGSLNVPITDFISSAPFSCKIKHYFWREHVGGSAILWPNDLVTVDVSDNNNLKFKVNTDDNRYAIVG